MSIEEIIKNFWVLIVAVVGYVWRTESSRIKTQTRLDHIEREQGRDREETRTMFAEIRTDVKDILARLGHEPKP